MAYKANPNVEYRMRRLGLNVRSLSDKEHHPRRKLQRSACRCLCFYEKAIKLPNWWSWWRANQLCTRNIIEDNRRDSRSYVNVCLYLHALVLINFFVGTSRDSKLVCIFLPSNFNIICFVENSYGFFIVMYGESGSASDNYMLCFVCMNTFIDFPLDHVDRRASFFKCHVF